VTRRNPTLRYGLVAALALVLITATACNAPGLVGLFKPTPTRSPIPLPPKQPTVTEAPAAVTGGRADPDGNDCPTGFLLKGTSSPSGERMYYEPDAAGYQRAISTVCFTAGQDARAAGYRSTKR